MKDDDAVFRPPQMPNAEDATSAEAGIKGSDEAQGTIG
jgi:hypothetical protein